MSPDSLCRCQVQVSVYCARRIPAHLRAPNVQSCCTLSISASYHVFVYGRYRKSSLVFMWLSDLDSSLHHTFLWGAVGPHGRLAQITVNRAPISGGGLF